MTRGSANAPRTITAIAIAATLMTACSAGQPAGSASPTGAGPTTPAAAAPTQTAPPSPSSAATEAPPTNLEGTWVTEPTTCDQQTATLERAGFSADDMATAGFDPAACFGHGSVFTILFAGDRLRVIQDGEVGWDGGFRIVDEDTFEAGDSSKPGDFYLTYRYGLDGDTLTVDMVRDDYPTTSADELVGEQIAQTVIYETAPFERQPD
jgi:hypothetical protein